MAKHASPHSEASVWLISGRRLRPVKFSSPRIRLHPCAQQRIEQPAQQRTSLKDDVGPQ